MSRCQHGEVISIYCLNQGCTWREPGGCQSCFKRYHSHPSNIGTITHEKLDQLYRKMIVRPDPKAKSRIFQQAIYNYLMIMKSQLTSSIDSISRTITNRLSYPYMNKSGQLEAFNKIKNKQLRKLNKKQLKSFVSFATESSKQSLQQNQRITYVQQVSLISTYIQKINQAFVIYSKAIQQLDSSFNVQLAFIDKIKQISNSIQTIIKQSKPASHRQDSQASGKSRQKRTVDLLQTSYQKVRQSSTNPTNKDRDRKISLDFTSQTSGIRNKLNKYNENQLNQRKKRLLQMDNAPKNTGMDQIKVDLINQNAPKNELKPQNKLTNVEKSAQKDISRDFSADKGFYRQGRLHTKQDQHEVDPRSQIVHTTLPRQASKPKLYEYSKDVKQKKVTIPVKISEQKAECSSPILKKKKTLIMNNKGLNLFKVQSLHQQQKEFEKQQQQKQQTDTQTTKQQGTMLLKDSQAQSLALLISSLSLSAQQAVPLLESSLRYSPNNLSSAEYLSYLYLETGKPKQCLDICNRFLQQIENSAESKQLAQHLTNNKAAALNMLGRYSESISILETCVRYCQKDIYYKNLADAYFSIGIYEQAAPNYEKAIKLNPEMDQALFNLAVCLYMQGHYIESQVNVQKALKINAKNESYTQLNKQIINKICL